jgi:ankyrin repeat protein
VHTPLPSISFFVFVHAILLSLAMPADVDGSPESGKTESMDKREQSLLTAVRANDWQSVLQILEHGADPDTEGPFGPVIFMALLLGHAMVARLLVESGADLHAADDKGRTPLHWAAKTGDVELILAMIDGEADVLALDYEGETPLDVLEAHEQGRVLDAVRRRSPGDYAKWQQMRGQR